jgi:hypothetical protein
MKRDRYSAVGNSVSSDTELCHRGTLQQSSKHSNATVYKVNNPVLLPLLLLGISSSEK